MTKMCYQKKLLQSKVLNIYFLLQSIRRLFRDGDDKIAKQDIKFTMSSSAVVSSSVLVPNFVFNRLLF